MRLSSASHFFLTLSVSSLAFSYSFKAIRNELGFHSRSLASSSKHKLVELKRDASTLVSGGTNNEGEDHNRLSSPEGSFMKDLKVGDNGDEIMLYWSRGIDDAAAEQAFVMIHGKLRDGANYWTIMNQALQSAVKDKVQGASANSLVVAPQFFSTIFNKGQYSDSELAWGDVNAWQAGDVATHPTGTTSTSFDALDAIVQEFSNQTHYSSLKNLTLVGHGGGGQLMQRYSVVGSDSNTSSLNIRYITGDPSSSLYFTEDRPKGTGIAKSDCPLYDTWRYGFSNFTGTFQGKQSPQEYFQEYVKRDLVALVANDDITADGDQYCMAKMQGGTARRDRSLNYWAYIQQLAGTGFDLENWPGSFDALPDWSHLSGNWTNHNLVVIENVGHNPDQVFGSDLGRAALFENDKNKIKPGWRPPKFDFKLNDPIQSLTSDLDDVKETPTSNLGTGNPKETGSSHSSNNSSISDAVSPISALGSLLVISLLSAIFLL